MQALTLNDFLASEAIKALHRPIKEAKGLPTVVYTNGDFFRLEQETLFPKQWVGVAYAHEIPEPGDAVPIKTSGLPVILVRGKDGKVRAFHNVCRHRGTIVLKEPAKRARTLRCMYHSWTYDLDGKLRSRPLWDGREDPSEDSLVPVECRVWCDIIFVNLSGDAPPLEAYFRFLTERWKIYDFDAIKPYATREWNVKTNWKLFALGVLEPYHEPFIHPQIVGTKYDEATGKKVIDNDTFTYHLEENCIGLSTPSTDRDYGLSGELPLLPGPPNDFERSMDIFLLFPNSVVVVATNHVFQMICTPLAADEMRVKVAIYAATEAATSPELAKDCESVLDDWRMIMEQDMEALELQQAGKVSPVADDNKFSPLWESTAHYFEKRVMEELA